MSSGGDEVEVVILWEALLKESPVYEPVLDIFSGKAHKAPNIDTKRNLLLNIVSRPWEEYFLRGSSQADDFKQLKKQCYAGWMSVSNHTRVWTAPYMAEKFVLLLVLRDQIDSEKKVQVSSRAATGRAAPMNTLKRAFKDLSTTYINSLQSYLETK